MRTQFSNFQFLEKVEPQLYRLGALAETYFSDDPNTCLIKLRQLSELTAQLTASRFGLEVSPNDSLADVLRRLRFECSLPREVGDLFHSLRIAGNQAAHGAADDHSGALNSLKLARQLSIWYFRTFHRPAEKFGPFVPPSAPSDANEQLTEELNRLRAELFATQTKAERLKAEAEAAAEQRKSAEEIAASEREERTVWEALAEEAERERLHLSVQLQAALALARSDDAPATEIVVELARDAAGQISLDEAETRAIIDQQLRDAGWEADTSTLRYSNGARPVKGRNRAIAVNRRSIGTPYRRAKGTPLLRCWVVDAGRGFRAAGGVGRA
jgi:type I restriction enzyme R subunit